MENLHQAYLNVAQHLSIPSWKDDKTDVKRLIQDHLRKPSICQWLLVFDNTDDIDMWTTKCGSDAAFRSKN